MKKLFALFVLVACPACASPLGLDDARKLAVLDVEDIAAIRRDFCDFKARYPSSTIAFADRAAILWIQANVPGYPVDGICSQEFEDALDLLLVDRLRKAHEGGQP